MDTILLLLGFWIFICTVAQGVGTFTQDWLKNDYGDALGIIPYNTADPAWFIASSYMMLAAFFLMVLVLIHYIVLVHRTSKFGYLAFYRRTLYAMAFETVIVMGLTVISLILLSTNLKGFYSVLSLGYSAWICVGSTCASVGIVILCIFSAKKFNQY